MKKIINNLKLNILKTGKKVESKVVAFYRSLMKYAKKNPRKTLIISGVTLVIIIMLVVLLLPKGKKVIVTTPSPFTQITTYKLNAIPSNINFGKTSSELKKSPSNISIYQTQEKPLTGLQETGNLQKILQTLGFTSGARNYSNKDAITYYEKGKSLTVSLIGDKISFTTGLNVEPELLKQDNNIRSLADLLQTGKYFFSSYKLNPDTQFSDPKTVYSKMGELGLYEISNLEQADVITYIWQPKIDSLNIENNEFLPYISLTKNGKIVALKMFNKKIVAATKNPVISFNKLKKSLKDNQAVSLEKIESKYLNPQKITIKKTQILYYYNEKKEILTPVITLQVTLQKDNEEKDATLYLPAFEKSYYY